MGSLSPISLFLLISCLFMWGSAYPYLKLTMPLLGIAPDDVQGKFAFAGIRFMLGASGLGIAYLISLRKNPELIKSFDSKFFSQVILLGLLQTTLLYAAFYTGVARVMGAKAAVIGGMGSIFLAIGAHIVHPDDKLTPTRILGISIGFLGLIILNIGGLKGAQLWTFRLNGEGLLLVTAMLTALTSLWAKKLGQSYDAVAINVVQMFFGSAILLMLGVGELGSVLHRIFAHWQLVLALCYLSAVSAVGFSIYYHLLQENKAGIIASYRFLIPFFGAVLSICFVPGESWSWQIALALSCIIASIILSRSK